MTYPEADYLSSADHARWLAARAKRDRKLAAKYTGKPDAQRRKVAMEAEFAQGVPLDEEHFPRLSPEPPLSP